MNNYRAIIVDDEASARNILSSLLASNCPEIEVLEKCSDLESGAKAIREHKPDLVFLDIEMPNYAGYEIGTFFEQIDFEIIFVTAYDSYAIKAFELSAVDYLLKPIDINRLTSAIDRFMLKAKDKRNAINYQVLLESIESSQAKKILVQVPNGQKILQVEDIVVIQASESYSDIYLKDGSSYTYSKNLKHFENLFDQNKNFVRTHKSWLVNTDYMKSYSKSNFTIELENGLTAKLSKYKKEDFERAILT